MTPQFPSYDIRSWPGCANARMQAVQTADRPICAVTTALASYVKTGKLYGTLSGKGPDVISDWAHTMCKQYMVSPGHMDLWVDALNGREFDARNILTHLRGMGQKNKETGSYEDVDLDPYQINIIKRLLAAGGVVGAYMGTGKTTIAMAAAIGFIKNVREENPGVEIPGRCWIVGPLNSIPTWERAKANELSAYFREVKFISADSVHKYVSVAEGDVLIVDETHRFGRHHKSHGKTTRRTDAIHKVRSRFAFCLPLSGTVVQAGVAAQLSLKDLAVPGLALFAKTWGAGEAFDCIVRNKFGCDLAKPPSHAKPAFMEWLEFGVQIITPDSKEVQSAFQLPGQRLEEVVLNDPWPSLEEDVARVANAAFAETGEFPHAQEVAHLLARDGVDRKIEWLGAELEDLDATSQVAIFANYTETLDRIEEFLRDMGRSYVRVDGSVTGLDRTEAERKFQVGEAQIFLGQCHAASESMNLQNCTISIGFDYSRLCIDYCQLLCRTHRRGQDKPCLHIDLVHNRFQARIVDCLRAGQDFNAEVAEYQEVKRCLKSIAPAPVL